MEKGEITLKSGFKYSVEVIFTTMSKTDKSYPETGELKVSKNTIDQLSKDAKRNGSWQSVQEMELAIRSNRAYYHLNILVSGLPEANLTFKTVGVNT